MSNAKADIQEALLTLRHTLPEGVELVCVSKYYSKDAILAAYEVGARCFGESRVQELLDKAKTLPEDIKWHFIGHLQTNKIRKLLPYVSLIHGVDSWHLLEKINEVAAQETRTVDVLLEVKISEDEAKTGFSFSELLDLLHQQRWRELSNVHICGLMGVASNIEDTDKIRREFSALHCVWLSLRQNLLSDNPYFTTLSMGMTGDWKIAIEQGSTMVRIGHGIFENKGVK